jgi:putative ABC transport system permease protein
MRYAIRTLLKTPGFCAVAIATIALGIAANTAIFSVVNGVLLRPLPFPDEARVVRVTTTTADERESNHSAGDFLDLQAQNQTLTALAGFRGEVSAVTVDRGEPAQIQSAWVTAEFFDVLGAPAMFGRTFTKAQDGRSGERLVILSHATWRQLFGSDAAVVGRTLRINGQPYTLAGVMPPRVQWPQGAGLWLLAPTTVPPSPIETKDPAPNRDVRYFDAIARLKPGVSLEAARDDLHAIALRIQSAHPETSGGRDVRAIPIRQALTGDVRGALLLIQSAVALVLLIACANVSSLLIARATGRRRELAIRAALGARRGHLVRQLLAESLVLGAAGGVAGILASSWLIGLLLKLIPEGLPQMEAITLDTTVAAAAVLMSLATGLLFGVLPAVQASRAQAAHAIKDAGERGSTRARGRSLLVVGEIALTLVLLVGAGLLANSFLRLQRVDPGFRPEQATIAELTVPVPRYPKGADQTRLYHRLLDGLAARPELQAVGVGFPAPFRASNASASFFIEGRSSTSRADRPFAHLATVSGGYFPAMGIPLMAGRAFDQRDGETAPPVAIVNSALARKYWPGENAVGKRLRFEDRSGEPWYTVVGVVGDARQLGLREQPPPLLYVPYEQFALPFTSVVVRSTLPVGAVTSLLKAQLAGIDGSLPFGDITTLEAVVSQSVDEPRFRATLIGIFALLALVLAAVGVYGLISYTVTQRTREIGIRVALGAAPAQVILPVVREGLVLALSGIAIGLAGALVAARALTTFLFGVGASDPATFVGVALLLLGVAVLASYIPSRRALKVDPIVALRAE